MTDTNKVAVRKSESKVAEVQPTRFGSIEGLRNEIDRVFRTFQENVWHVPFWQGSFDLAPFTRENIGAISPAFDVVDKDGVYEVTAELPGLDEKNVEVTLSDNVLVIRGEKKEEKEDRKKDQYLSERRYGAFRRMFRLPEGVDRDRIEASFKNGVLTVVLPRTPTARQGEKTITIKAA